MFQIKNLLYFFQFLLCFQFSFGEIIQIDTLADEALLKEANCFYSDKYEDFWAWGCRRNLSSVNQQSGFWTECLSESCELIYSEKPIPNFVGLRSYIGGEGQIVISRDVKYVLETVQNGSDWGENEYLIENPEQYDEITIELTHLESNSDFNFVIIDQINYTINGEEIQIDNIQDVYDNSLNMFEITCHYSEDFKDNKYWGCREDPEISSPENNKIGFWTQCQATDVCKLSFFNIIPESIKISAYVKGDARINVNGFRTKITTSTIETKGWSFNLTDASSTEPNEFTEAVRILLNKKALGGYAMIDKLFFSSESFTEPPTTPSPTTTTTMTTTTTTTPPSPTTKAGVGIVSINFFIILFSLFIVF